MDVYLYPLRRRWRHRDDQGRVDHLRDRRAGRSIEHDRNVRSIKACLACLNVRCTRRSLLFGLIWNDVRRLSILPSPEKRHPAHFDLWVRLLTMHRYSRWRNDIILSRARSVQIENSSSNDATRKKRDLLYRIVKNFTHYQIILSMIIKRLQCFWTIFPKDIYLATIHMQCTVFPTTLCLQWLLYFVISLLVYCKID